ncbi:MAG: DUF222 domain-containing protein [Actinomycetota bacterium]
MFLAEDKQTSALSLDDDAGPSHRRTEPTADAASAAGSVLRAADLDDALKLLAEADTLRAQAAALVGGLADSGLAEWLGYVSMARLVAHRSGCRNTTARAFLRVARFLVAHPLSAAAVRDGRLSWANAETLARAAADGRSASFAVAESELLAESKACAPETFDRLVFAWRSRVDAEADAADAERSWRQRSFTMQLAFDGSCHGRFRLDPVATEIVAAALETPPDPTGALTEPRTLAQRRADALIDLCLMNGPAAGDDDGPARVPVGVDVVVDVETLAGTNDPVVVSRLRQELGRGGPISGPGLDRLLCDASFRSLITGGKQTVLAYSRSTPDIPPTLRRAVKLRDGRCTFTGCDRPAHWCDLHHIVPRNRGGPTTVENLTLLCRFHHTTVHEGGWQLTRGPDGAIHVTMP